MHDTVRAGDDALHIDGSILERVGTDLAAFQRMLANDRAPILTAIERSYQKTLAQERRKAGRTLVGEHAYPGFTVLIFLEEGKPISRIIERPPLTIMRIHNSLSHAALSRTGREAGVSTYDSKDHIRPVSRKYWEAAQAAGFIPQAQFLAMPGMTGLFLQIRAPDGVTTT